MEPKGKRQVPSLGGSPTTASPEGLFPVLGNEALEEILGPPKIFMEESAGGTLHCASCLWQPGRDPGLAEAWRQVRSCPHLPLSPTRVVEPSSLHLLELVPLPHGTSWVGWLQYVCVCCCRVCGQRTMFLKTVGPPICKVVKCVELHQALGVQRQGEFISATNFFLSFLQLVFTMGRPIPTGKCGIPSSGSTASCPASSALAGMVSRTARRSRALRSIRVTIQRK